MPFADGVTITNQMHNDIHAILLAAQTMGAVAEDAYRQLPVRISLGPSRDPDSSQWTKK